jgi:hypothetical protein
MEDDCSYFHMHVINQHVKGNSYEQQAIMIKETKYLTKKIIICIILSHPITLTQRQNMMRAGTQNST